jgi:hypothetical protein
VLSKWLEWAVVIIPVIAGFMAWVFPIQQATGRHRFFLFVGYAVFSALIYWQQQEARQEHLTEFRKLATKDDLKKIPSVSEIVGEFKRIAPAGVNQSPWGMTDAQLSKLTERISIFATFTSDRKASLISCVLGDQDALKFGERLTAAFRAAHWNMPDGVNQIVLSGSVQGIIIQLRDKEDHPPGLSELIQTLRESGIEPTAQIDPSIPHDEFHIIIGNRPSS